jgi:hypothetical protein
MEALVEDGHTKLGNPSGCAGEHSGMTWLRDLCETHASFKKFTNYAAAIVPNLRNKFGGPSCTKKLFEPIKPTKVRPGHLRKYYAMQTFRVVRHAHHLSTPGRAPRPPCPDSKYLWEEVLLKYAEGGAITKTRKFGVRSWTKASRFCKLMRKVKSNYCMCDLSCWVCLT